MTQWLFNLNISHLPRTSVTAETGGTSWAAHKCSFYSFFRSARLELDQLVVAQAPKAGHLDYTLRQIFKSTFNILVFWKFFLTILKNCSEIYLSNLIFFIFIWSRVGKYMTNIYIEIYCSYALWRDNQLDLWYGILKYIYRAYSLKNYKYNIYAWNGRLCQCAVRWTLPQSSLNRDLFVDRPIYFRLRCQTSALHSRLTIK